MFNKLKAKYALRWAKHVDIEVLEKHVQDLRIKGAISGWYEQLNKRMIDEFFGGKSNV